MASDYGKDMYKLLMEVNRYIGRLVEKVKSGVESTLEEILEELVRLEEQIDNIISIIDFLEIKS